MVTLQVFNYNNYYNRQLKRSDVLENYGTPLYELSGVNFNPNDGITTEQDLGNLLVQYSGLGNYLLVVEAPNTIVSRWFIIEVKRNRGGQYKALLKRDVLADYYDQIIDSDLYLEKTTLPISNPLIFNTEGMLFN